MFRLTSILLACFFSATVIQAADPLPGTSPLKWDGDIASRMIDGIDKFLLNELAKSSGISRPYLTEIETGKKDGSLRAIKALANALNVDMGVLV